MRKINKQKVSDYIKSRTDEEIKHCPDCLACACNDAVRRFGHKNALDFLKLICCSYFQAILLKNATYKNLYG